MNISYKIYSLPTTRGILVTQSILRHPPDVYKCNNFVFFPTSFLVHLWPPPAMKGCTLRVQIPIFRLQSLSSQTNPTVLGSVQRIDVCLSSPPNCRRCGPMSVWIPEIHFTWLSSSVVAALKFVHGTEVVSPNRDHQSVCKDVRQDKGERCHELVQRYLFASFQDYHQKFI
jgi:hypothetical protein